MRRLIFSWSGRKRRGARCLAGALGGAIMLSSAWFTYLQLKHNFDAVVPGEVYRSAQPSPADLARYKQEYGIKTVVNLRGENKGSGWYDAEVDAATKLDIAHVDFRMSARRQLSQQEAAELIALLARAEKPLLIHCNWGADRTSLAAALYVAAVGKLGEAAAEGQISMRYGHLSLPLVAGYAMDRTFEALEPWLGFPNS